MLHLLLTHLSLSLLLMMLHSNVCWTMRISTALEGRVYKCGRALIEVVLVGATSVICEFTSSDESYVSQLSYADVEIGLLSGRWQPSSAAALRALAS